jgi:spore coat protein H
MKSLKSLSLFLAVLLSFTLAHAATKKPKTETEDLFTQPKVYQLKIEIPSASLESLKNDPRKYIKGVIREGDKVYADVGIRLKGSGSFQPLQKKPSLAIKLNEFVSGVRFHGHTKIFLNNSHQDPTFMCEAVGSELFRAADVPVSRINYARIELNGRDLGLYVLAEAVNKDFLGKYFTRTKGNLYEGSNVDITDKLEKDSGDESKDQKDLKALAEAIKEPDAAARMKKVSGLLDVDRFVSFAATEVFAVHRDGYTMDRNNYRIYNDPSTNKLVFIPHGFDQLFGKPDAPVLPQWKGLVAKAILETPDGKAKYLDRMSKLLGAAFKADVAAKKIDELTAVIKPALGSEGTQFDLAVAQLKTRIAERARFVESELKKQTK